MPGLALDEATFQTTERRLAGQRPPAIGRLAAITTVRVGLAAGDRQGWVAPERLMVGGAHVAGNQLEDPLTEQLLDVIRIAVVVETVGQPPDDAEALLQVPKLRGTGIRNDSPAVESGRHIASSTILEIEFSELQGVPIGGVTLMSRKCLEALRFYQIHRPTFTFLVKYSD